VLNFDGSSATLPAWYLEIPEPDRVEDLQEAVGDSLVLFCARDREQLIVSFGNTEDTDHPELDWPAWTDRFARQKGWSHLTITAPKDTWFREPALIEFLKNLREIGFFKRYKRVAFFGASPAGAGFAALSFAALSPGATVVAFEPQSTLDVKRVPWDKRFKTGAKRDWSLPFSDAAATLGEVTRAYIAFDPFRAEEKRHVARLPADKLIKLQGFGLENDIGVALKRMGVLPEILEKALAGDLPPSVFYRMIRGRKDLYIYRRTMEGHIDARDRPGLRKIFTDAFRRRARLRRAKKDREKQQASQPSAPVRTPIPAGLPDAPTRPEMQGRRYPRTLGNVWGLQDDGTRFRYMSDQYGGTVMGFEERGRITLGETPPLAIGMAAFGHGVGLERPLPEAFEFHVVDETLDGKQPAFAAKSQGVISQRLAANSRQAYRTLVAISEPQAGITATEAQPDSPLYRNLMARIATARATLRSWDKDFHLDHISLSLLSGAPGTPLNDAIRHYGSVAQNMRHDAAIAAGQASFPHIIVSQSAGTATDGRSQVILAEGQLDLAHPMLGIIVATPKYPYALMHDMPATHAPAAQMLVDELEALALATVQENQRWHCPSMRQAYLRGLTIVVEFTALNDLVLGEGHHGFDLQGCDNDARIIKVQTDGTNAFLTFDKPPTGQEIFVTYAWGTHLHDAVGNKSANQGALRDSWSRASVITPDKVLHRFALSGRVRLVPSDLQTNLPEVTF